MKVSVKWVQQFLDFELPPIDELVEKIGAQLGAIEQVENIGTKYQGIVVGKIVSIAQHPNADKLHICLIDDGGKTPDVERTEQGYVQVVCGAPNIYEGMFVPWLPPGATVPESYEHEPLVLEARSLRGVISNGMLASARELGFGADHSGILMLNPHDAVPGADFATTYQLNDHIIDIENKMFTHRPDCFGHLGVAREIAGILGHPFTSPAWYKTPLQNVLEPGTVLPLEVQNDLRELVPRFMAVALHTGLIGPSAAWLQSYLARVGVRPINNVVDITNYMMLLTGQPLHAYDYDKVAALSGEKGAKLVVRYAKQGEKLRLLNGKEIEPRPEAIMIATDNALIGLAGIMGGSDTEVDAGTRRIILECATFDMYSIRRTSMTHGLFTDAVTRFNKGQSPLQNPYVVGESLRLLGQLAQATQASEVIDVVITGNSYDAKDTYVSYTAIQQLLSVPLDSAAVIRLLQNVEFAFVDQSHDLLHFKIPFWRTDIAWSTHDKNDPINAVASADLAEEVGRLYGYDKLPLELPQRSITPAPQDPLLTLKSTIRRTLARAGANEVLTYSFVHGNLLDKAGQDKTQAFKLSNALSPDLQYYRLSLMPSLLDKVHANVKAGYGQFALFETGKAHNTIDTDSAGLPIDDTQLGLVYVNKNSTQATYFAARNYLTYLLDIIADDCWQIVGWSDLSVTAQQIWRRPQYAALLAPYDLERSGFVVGKGDLDNEPLGIVGEFTQSVCKAFKLPVSTAGFELLLDYIWPRTGDSLQYTQLPRFPKVEQDICLKVKSAMAYQGLHDLALQTLEQLKPMQTVLSLVPVDIYQRSNDPTHKQITLRLTIASYEKTLTADEVAQLLDKVAEVAHEKLGAERV